MGCICTRWSKVEGLIRRSKFEVGGLRPENVPSHIFGMTVRWERRGKKHGKRGYERLRVHCDNPWHGECTKSRVLTKDVHIYGPRAAEAYLGAWLEGSFMPGMHARKHRKDWRPTRADIFGYLNRHPAP